MGFQKPAFKYPALKILTGVLALALLTTPLLTEARVRVGVGIGIGGPGPYYGYGPGYYGSPYYYPPAYYYGPGYYDPAYYYGPPAVVYAPPVVTVQQAPSAYWYYCPPARAYYPYVNECPSGWQAVAATRSPPRSAAKPVQAPSGKVTYSLGDVLFATGKADLQPAAMGTLDTLLASINQEPNRRIVVEGHTDAIGSGGANRELSQRRADAVMQYLIAHGVDPQRISAVGKGEAAPVASNATAAGRRSNRRVDIVLG